jgi:hypothetical protein
LKNEDEPISAAAFRTFIVMLDILETMQYIMPKSFQQLVKAKDSSMKKAVDSILLRSQQFIFLKVSQHPHEDEDSYDLILPRVTVVVNLMHEVSSFPKAFDMINKINTRVVKDAAKRFNLQ